MERLSDEIQRLESEITQLEIELENKKSKLSELKNMEKVAPFHGEVHWHSLNRDYQSKEEVVIYDYADLIVPVLSRMH